MTSKRKHIAEDGVSSEPDEPPRKISDRKEASPDEDNNKDSSIRKSEIISRVEESSAEKDDSLASTKFEAVSRLEKSLSEKDDGLSSTLGTETVAVDDNDGLSCQKSQIIDQFKETVCPVHDNVDGPANTKTVSLPIDVGKIFGEWFAPHTSSGPNDENFLEPKIEDEDQTDGCSLPKYDLKSYECPAGVVIYNSSVGREGSEKDTADLLYLFNDILKFRALSFFDSTGEQFRNTIETISKEDFSHLGGLVIVVMTHGTAEGKLLFHGNTGSSYTSEVDIEKDLVQPFCGKNPTLTGKPIVFILTACRGGAYHDETDDETDAPGGMNLPRNADTIVAYSTSEGDISVLNHENGSWFIQEFINVVKKHHKKHHLLELLTEVQRRVAEKTFQQDGVSKNMPEHVNRLRKKLYF